MADNNEVIYEYNRKYNWTDPSVRVKRALGDIGVAKTYSPQYDSNPEYAGVNDINMMGGSSVRYDGIIEPIIKINEYVCNEGDVKMMKMSSMGVIPTLKLLINDEYGRIRQYVSPGMSCVVTVIITMPIDGVYKKINCSFYIYEIQYFEKSILYVGKYYCPILERRLCCAWTNDDKKHPTTYELFKKIAIESGLGFACTEKVENVLDYRYAVARRQTYLDVIMQHTAFGGIDNDSIYDSWIDFYGYLVLVNLKYVMTEEISSLNLLSHHLCGNNFMNAADFDDQEREIVYSDLLPRMVTNHEYFGDTSHPMVVDVTFSKMEDVIDNSKLLSQGTENVYFNISTIAAGGTNSINTIGTSIQENSVYNAASNKIHYTFDNCDFIGCEFGAAGTDSYPILAQQKRHEAYLNSLRARRLKVTMSQPNLGLTRGILITVLPFEFTPESKNALITMMRIKDGLPADFNEGYVDEGIISNPTIGIPNVAKRGIYYIDGVEYEYSSENKNIEQILFLIKKDGYTDYSNIVLEKLGLNASDE